MKIKIKFDRVRDREVRSRLVHALLEAGVDVRVDDAQRYLDGRVYVVIDDKRIEQA